MQVVVAPQLRHERTVERAAESLDVAAESLYTQVIAVIRLVHACDVCGSDSMARATSAPACVEPKVKPPTPAKRSTTRILMRAADYRIR